MLIGDRHDDGHRRSPPAAIRISPSAPGIATLFGAMRGADSINTYRLVVRPDIRLARGLPIEPPLTSDMVVGAIPGVVVREVSEHQWGPRVVDVQLDRDTHDQALDDIERAVEAFGFSVAEAVVSEWAGDVTKAAIRSVIGDAAMEDPVVAFLVAIAADVVGLFVSSEERKLQARYEANRLYFGWDLRQIPQQQPSMQGHQPGFRAKRALRR